MNKSWMVVALLAMAAPGYGQTSPAPADAAAAKIPDDLGQLVGKKVLVGRIPLCVPKTYSVNLTYAGKPATVVSYAKDPMLARTNVNRMPSRMRSMMEDALHGGRLTFRFDDGTVLDTCVNTLFSQLAPNMDLIQGDTTAQPTASAPAAAPSIPAQPTPAGASPTPL
jgi:hypothetical protein